MEPVARRYGCSLSTISTLKRRLSVQLQESFGEHILMEVGRRPEWQSSIRGRTGENGLPGGSSAGMRKGRGQPPCRSFLYLGQIDRRARRSVEPKGPVATSRIHIVFNSSLMRNAPL